MACCRQATHHYPNQRCKISVLRSYLTINRIVLPYPSVVKHSPTKTKISNINVAWWRHQIETFSALLVICAGNSPVPVEIPTQRPVTRSFDVYFDLRPNKRLSKELWGWWFETQSRPLWRHRNGSDCKCRRYACTHACTHPLDWKHYKKIKMAKELIQHFISAHLDC